MFNPFYCLFEYSAHDNYTLQINPHSGINPEHLNYFKFIGRVVGLAVFHRRFLDAFFVVSFYKMILKMSVKLADMEAIDADFYRSLVWMLENDITDALDLTFSTEDDRFGEVVTVELKPGGEEIPVTNENKKEYVDLVTNWRIQKRIDEQFQNFAAGFNELIPQDLINVFDERELELLIGGIAEMDVDDWKKHTDYRGYTESDDVIQWFWKVDTPICFWNRADCRLYGRGMQRRNHGYCSLRRARRGSRSMASRIYKEAMDHADSQSRKPEMSVNFPKHILGILPHTHRTLTIAASTESTCRPTNLTTNL